MALIPVETRPARTLLPRLRWYICGLLFFATTVNYIDRQVLGLLKPVLEKDLGWRESDYGWIVFAFQFAYTLMMPFAGRLIDRLGTRLGYLLAVVVWSCGGHGSLAGPQCSGIRFGAVRTRLWRIGISPSSLSEQAIAFARCFLDI